MTYLAKDLYNAIQLLQELGFTIQHPPITHNKVDRIHPTKSEYTSRNRWDDKYKRWRPGYRRYTWCKTHDRWFWGCP